MRHLLILITLPLFVLDYFTKQYIYDHFADPDLGYAGDRVKVIDGFFDIVRVHNKGVAFGLGNNKDWSNVVFGCVSVTALFLIGWLWKTKAFPTRVSRVAVALLLSGVLGNLVDRFKYGYVVDFLHFYVGTNEWPSFNVADSAICVAAVLLFYSAFQKSPVISTEEKTV